jgi:hypothetical protein
MALAFEVERCRKLRQTMKELTLKAAECCKRNVEGTSSPSIFALLVLLGLVSRGLETLSSLTCSCKWMNTLVGEQLARSWRRFNQLWTSRKPRSCRGTPGTLPRAL